VYSKITEETGGVASREENLAAENEVAAMIRED